MIRFILFLLMAFFSYSSINCKSDSGHPYYELFYDKDNLAFHSPSSLVRIPMEHFSSRLPQSRSEQKVHAAYALFLEGKSRISSSNEDELSLSTSARFLSTSFENSLFHKLKSGKESISDSFLFELFNDSDSPWSPPLTKKRIMYWNAKEIGKAFVKNEMGLTIDAILKTIISEFVIEVLKKISSDPLSFEKEYSVFQKHFSLPERLNTVGDEMVTKKEAESVVIHFYQFFTPYNLAKKIITTVSKEDLHAWFLKSSICSKIYMGKDGEITLRGVILILYQLGYINPNMTSYNPLESH